jgi:hypothetical protein
MVTGLVVFVRCWRGFPGCGPWRGRLAVSRLGNGSAVGSEVKEVVFVVVVRAGGDAVVQ